MRRKRHFIRNLSDLEGSSSLDYMATFINPVDHRLYDVLINRDSDVTYVVAPLPNEVYQQGDSVISNQGQGSWDDDDEVSIDGLTYYRSHTPGGVRHRKLGLGLMLYSGLALGVVYRKSEGGVFSELYNRSGDATAWWNAQVERGFAEESSETHYEQKEVSISLDTEMIDKCELDSESCEADIDSISPDYVDVYVDYTRERLVQVLSGQQVVDSGRFVLMYDDDDVDLDKLMADADPIPTEVLLGVDMSTTADPALLFLMLERLEEAEVPRKELKRFVERYPGPLQGASATHLRELMGQERFPFEEVEESARESVEQMEKEFAANSRKADAAWSNFFGELSEPIT